MLLSSCKDDKSTDYYGVTPEAKEKKSNSSEGHPGKKLMENQCYLCHSPSAPEKEGRIGPPMIAIKAHYMTDEISKEEFIASVWNFVEQPSDEKVKLKGAVKRFGIMPYQPFKKEDVEKIAEYLYDYQIEEPEWFKEHWEKGHKKARKPYKNTGKTMADNSPKTLEEIGLNYALGTKKVLGKNLMGKMQSQGTEAALTFCNEQAYPLTDSMAVLYNAKIKRVSDKPRNPNNQANEKELAMIAHYKTILANNETIAPIVEKGDTANTFYYPITTNSMCLKCHGVPNTQITPQVLSSIQALYPEDQATGYDVNQVRGIWSIDFKKQ
jgi:nitrate reductase cytochrome c-type subunit